MSRKFYSHLVEYQSIIIKLDELELSEDEKQHLAELVDATLHHAVLDAVLSELNESDKESFMKLMHTGDHTQIWEFLDKRVLRIEDKIQEAAEDLKKKIHQDIDEVKGQT